MYPFGEKQDDLQIPDDDRYIDQCLSVLTSEEGLQLKGFSYYKFYVSTASRLFGGGVDAKCH